MTHKQKQEHDRRIIREEFTALLRQGFSPPDAVEHLIERDSLYREPVLEEADKVMQQLYPKKKRPIVIQGLIYQKVY